MQYNKLNDALTDRAMGRCGVGFWMMNNQKARFNIFEQFR